MGFQYNVVGKGGILMQMWFFSKFLNPSLKKEGRRASVGEIYNDHLK
jgi:hypothetical protein